MKNPKVFRGLDPTRIPKQFLQNNPENGQSTNDNNNGDEEEGGEERMNDQTNYLNSIIRSSGQGTIILLSQGSIWELNSKIIIDSDNVEIATEGYPTEPELQAQIHTIGKKEPTAISFHNTKNVKLSNLIIDGGFDYDRQDPSKNNFILGSGALVMCGGRSCKNPIVQFCTIRNPRSWSCLHVFDNCEGGRIVNNKIGPAGLPAPNGPWADGLSIACKNGLILNNEIVDATDGAIVIFCAPGTLCAGNTIIAKERNLLGGINLVDHGPYSGNYENTRILSNRIISDNAHIKLGIGVGPLTWAPNTEINRGGKVFDNLIGPGRFGYGIGMAGCKEFEVMGNRIVEGTSFLGNMSSMPEPLNAPPMAFLRSNVPGMIEDCKVQADFIPGRAAWLIGLEDGPSKVLRFETHQIRLLSTDQPIQLQNVTINLEEWGELRVVDRSNSAIIWSSGSRSSPILDENDNNSNPLNDQQQQQAPIRFNVTRFGFDPNGHLTIREVESGRLLWNPMGSLDGKVEIGDGASLILSDVSPFIMVKRRCGSIVWATEYTFERGRFELKAGQFICVTPDRITPTQGPPPIPNHTMPRPPPIPPRIGVSGDLPPPIPIRPNMSNGSLVGGGTLGSEPGPIFIYLDPNTSNLLIHNGNRFDDPFGRVIWASELFPNFPRQVPSRGGSCIFDHHHQNNHHHHHHHPHITNENGYDESKITKCVFQGGDGNLVTYANPDPENEDQKCAVWASGTSDCKSMKIFKVYSSDNSQEIGYNNYDGSHKLSKVEILFLNERDELIKRIP